MKIGNIVYEKELVNHTQSKYINYYNESVEYVNIDTALPTLYVGWSFMKASNPQSFIIQNADVLKKNIIINELYWEVSFKEGKASHIRGVDSFVTLAPQYYFSNYEYVNIDPVFLQIKDIEGLMSNIPEKIDVTYNYKNEMIYLLSGNKIYGINLKMYEYFMFDIDEIITRITQRTEVSHIDLEGTTHQHYYKIFPNFQHLKRYLIVILSK